VNPFGIAAAAAITSGVGSLGGLGGAVLLVPILTLTGTDASAAATLGLVSVAAGSVATATVQLRERTVNHRIGVSTEIAASSGAVAGALLSTEVSDTFLTVMLGLVAIAAAVLGGRRKGIRNKPDPSLTAADIGEHVGALSGAYDLNGGVVPYRAHRLQIGLGLMAISGLVAGLAGASGGFIKTPAQSEVMKVPVKVAAATTSFTIGITSAAALVVHASQERINPIASAGVVCGAMVGAAFGARMQSHFSPVGIRRFLSAVLLGVGVILLVRR